MDMLKGFARYDTFQKSKEHVQVRTLSGATVSLAAGILMLLLFISEVSYWLETRVEHHILVDTSQADREFDIKLDISFPSLPCDSVELVAENARGVPYDDSHVNIVKTPLSLGSDPRIARTLARNPFAAGVADAAKKGGCRVAGTVRVRKVAGDIRVAASRTLQNVDGRLMYVIPPEQLSGFNASHVIHHLSFGPAFPGQVNPLDATVSPTADVPAMYQYHIKVVPTLYEPLSGSLVDSQQFSVSDFMQKADPEAGTQIHPGVWFKVDFSAIMVRLVQTRRGFLQFLTSLCAILGGVFALSGIVDQIFYRALSSSKTK